jgi:hypothetical protein
MYIIGNGLFTIIVNMTILLNKDIALMIIIIIVVEYAAFMQLFSRPIKLLSDYSNIQKHIEIKINHIESTHNETLTFVIKSILGE